MYIEEIILDGFKSYQSRTTVSHFSPQFNAITGLNGSGKSNLLDSICFVMGIRSLVQMRVSKMDELVYKQGQAGTTKASVTLVFNNDDKSRSPPQYRDVSRISITRQIVIGGRDRYLLNGHNAKTSDIQSLFLSVQLNVNNPHFLIMQGRITKVINMKPHEILSLIEEAAGTRIYESKRLEAAKKIARKQTKFEEIQRVIDEDIEPALDSLKSERLAYNKWTALGRQVEELTRFCLAFSYYKDVKFLNQHEERLTAEESRRSNLEQQLQQIETALQEVQSEIDEKVQTKSKHEGPLAQLKAKIKDKNKEKTKARTSKEESTKGYKRALDAVATAEQAVAATQSEIDKISGDDEANALLKKSSSLQKQTDDKQTELKESEDLLEALKMGKEAGEGLGSLRSKLMSTKSELQNAKGEMQSTTMYLKKWEAEAKKSVAVESGREKELKKLEAELQHNKDAVEKLTLDLKNLAFDSNAYETLQGTCREVQVKYNSITETEDSKFSALKSALDIQDRYSPEDVMGPAFSLFEVEPQSSKYCLALEECGKGKLFHVVVRDDSVAQRVLESSQRRMTCIPLSQIRAPDLPLEKVKTAKRVLSVLESDQGALCIPLQIIKPTEQRFVKPLQFVFGTAILCADSATARTVSNNPSIRNLAITLAGDTYNPQGTVSGGSRVGLNNLLATFSEYRILRSETKELRDRLRHLQESIQREGKSREASHSLEAQLEVTKVTLQGVMEMLERSREHSTIGARDKLLRQIEEGKSRQEELRATAAHLEATIPEIEKELNDFQNNKQFKTAELHKRIETLKSEAKTTAASLKAHQKSIEGVRQKLAVLESQLADANESVEGKKTEAEIEKAKMEQFIESSTKIDAEGDQLNEELETLTSRFASASSELRGLTERKSDLEKRSSDLLAEVKRTTHSYKNAKKALLERRKRRAYKERANKWLVDELSSMNVPGSSFMFDGATLEESQTNLEALEIERSKLQRNVNKKVLNMLEVAETQLSDLKTKKSKVVQDKISIEAFMKDLDEKKAVALENCWTLVNEQFGSIFSSLLPNSTARLNEQEGKTFKEGLQLQVAFGGVWKASLSELSGGQRSLLALSLILALLKYKPAPLYILDEVDAALDLSHTQNIGRMISEHFKNSQFIIVSLKENLFNYADVLYRTQFVQGNSAITRTENRMPAITATGKAEDHAQQNKENVPNTRRKRVG